MRCAACLALLLSAALPALGGPAIAPGDLWLRHDIQRLADAGIISGPVTSWPLAWGPILADVTGDKIPADLPADVRAALRRVRGKAIWEMRLNELRYRARVSVAENPSAIRSFQNTPREEAEAAAGLSWTSQWLHIGLNVTAAANPGDGENARLDGSQLAVIWGNYAFAAGSMERWWGPGWDSSLILSNNARPIPAFTIERNFTDPFEVKWLRWLGPWDLNFIWGLMEEERAVPNTQFLGFRFNFRPHSSLEVGVSRTAQWCGDGRPCDLQTFWNLLIGNDNRGDGVTADTEPGNQTAAIDFRWSLAPFRLPAAIYAQAMAEDEAGGFPSRYIGQLGLEIFGHINDRWSYRVYLEGTETTCAFYSSEVRYNCAFNHSIYQSGYRYRGRVVGHSADNDARIGALGFLLVSEREHSLQGYVRAGRLNRGGPPDPANSLTPLPQDLLSVELMATYVFRFGRLEIGAGYDELGGGPQIQSSNAAKAFIQWRSDY